MRLMIPAILFYGIIRLKDYQDLECLLKGVAILTVVPFVVLGLYKGWIDYRSRVFTLFLYIVIVCHLVGNFFDGIWFLPCLFKYIIAASVSFYVFNTYIKSANIIYPLLLTFMIVLPWKHAMWFNAEFIIYFILGLMVRHFDFKKGGWYLLLIIPAVLFAYMWRFYSFYKVENTFYPLLLSGKGILLLYRQLSAICFCLFFYVFFRMISCRYTIFSQLGTKTLPIYTIHCTILPFAAGLLHIYTSTWLAWIEVTGVTILLMAVTLSIIYLSERHWMTNWLLCGNPEKTVLS